MISVREAAGNGNAPEPSRSLGEVVDDAGITMAVKGRLLDDPTVKGLRIDVDTREGVVYLHMKGSCAGCPSSTATLKHGIENLLRHFVPEVSEVRPV